jgi:hypothetical protein
MCIPRKKCAAHIDFQQQKEPDSAVSSSVITSVEQWSEEVPFN